MSATHVHTAAAEHLAADPSSELWGEHRSRYRFAGQFCAGKRTLDVACGAGFGLAMLADAGARPIGMDLDATALLEARRAAPRRGLARADALCLPLADASVEVVVSMETIEHVSDASRLIAEYGRVLAPGGTLIVSTPNRAFGPERLHHGNPFHVREFTAAELSALLHTVFDEVCVYGQRVDEHFRYVPFLMVEPDHSARALAWKALRRLPTSVRDWLAQRTSGRGFYPGETDFRFLPDATDGCHDLLAVCHGARS